MELDMGLYHDVFGWGLGAADVQQQAMGGYLDPDLGAWSYDMLDLSALNNPTEFLGKGVASGPDIVGGPLSDAVAAEPDAGSTTYQSTKSGLREMYRPGGEVLPSGRLSERTTRQGTATPGNGEEETPWVRAIDVCMPTISLTFAAFDDRYSTHGLSLASCLSSRGYSL